MKRISLFILSATGLIAMVLVAGVAVYAQDVVTLGQIKAAPGDIAKVPVWVTDTGGTVLGVGQAAGRRIQGLSFKVAYTPSEAVVSATFSRAGITASLKPLFEASPTSGNTAGYLASFDEETNPIPFTVSQSKASQGDWVAVLTLKISPEAAPGTVVTLTLDPAVTILTNQGGTITETAEAENLVLVNGSLTVTDKKP
jgi:hypothetical protein